MTEIQKNDTGMECRRHEERGEPWNSGWMDGWMDGWNKKKHVSAKISQKIKRTENFDGEKFLWDERYLLFVKIFSKNIIVI